MSLAGHILGGKRAVREDDPSSVDLLLPTMQQIFGFGNFRGLQAEACLAAMTRNDALVVMPTGAGKSLCYALPALHLPGVTLVVSPLIALMQDQVANLKAKGVAAELLSSSLTESERGNVLARLEGGSIKLLYCTPELLSTAHFKSRLRAMHRAGEVSMLAVDEAHCISSWGHDFRPAYRMLGEVRSILQGVACLALTATAAKEVQDDIVRQLRMAPNARRLVSSFNRPNITYSVRYLDVEQRQAAALRAANAAAAGNANGSISGAGALTNAGGMADDDDLGDEVMDDGEGGYDGGDIGVDMIDLAGDSDDSAGEEGSGQGRAARRAAARHCEAACGGGPSPSPSPSKAPRGKAAAAAAGGGGGGGGGASAVDEISVLKEVIGEAKERNGGMVPCAIVYCHKKETCEVVAARLNAARIPAAAYHGGMKHPLRNQVLADWQSGKVAVVAATIAFGMGIDKAQVRLVVHLNLPKAVEGFYQESGRAGRDGAPAHSVLIYSLDNQRVMDYLMKKEGEKRDAASGKKRKAGGGAAKAKATKTSQASEATAAAAAGKRGRQEGGSGGGGVGGAGTENEAEGVNGSDGSEGSADEIEDSGTEGGDSGAPGGTSSSAPAVPSAKGRPAAAPPSSSAAAAEEGGVSPWQAFSKVVSYARGRCCRRQALLAHFGERPKDAAAHGPLFTGAFCCDYCADPEGVSEALAVLEELGQASALARASRGRWGGRGGLMGPGGGAVNGPREEEGGVDEPEGYGIVGTLHNAPQVSATELAAAARASAAALAKSGGEVGGAYWEEMEKKERLHELRKHGGRGGDLFDKLKKSSAVAADGTAAAAAPPAPPPDAAVRKAGTERLGAVLATTAALSTGLSQELLQQAAQGIEGIIFSGAPGTGTTTGTGSAALAPAAAAPAAAGGAAGAAASGVTRAAYTAAMTSTLARARGSPSLCALVLAVCSGPPGPAASSSGQVAGGAAQVRGSAGAMQLLQALLPAEVDAIESSLHQQAAAGSGGTGSSVTAAGGAAGGAGVQLTLSQLAARLRSLRDVPVTLAMLSGGAGKKTNVLRKHADPQVADAAKGVVEAWKQFLAPSAAAGANAGKAQ